MKICMFVLNNCKRDARVLKEAETLADAGHEVRIIATLDEESEPYEIKNGFRILRVARNPLHYPFFKRIRIILGWLGRLTGLVFALLTLPFWPVLLLMKRSPRIIYQYIQQYLYLHLRPFFVILARPLFFSIYHSCSWKALKNEPADIYHCNDLATLSIGCKAVRRQGGKLVYDAHELFTEVHYISWVERLLFRRLEQRLIRLTDAVITVNEFIARELQKRYDVALPAVVMNCPPKYTRADEQSKNSLRDKLSLNDKVPIIVYVGIPNVARGSEKLISAAPLIYDGVIVFLGWGSEVEYLKKIVKQRGLSDRVLFTPPVAPEQVVEYISSANLGVIPILNISLNHYFATPNKLWECINAGLPIVSSDFPALKVVVEGYHLGKTCNPENPKDIAAAINWVLADKARYNRMKKNTLIAAEIFNWERESKKFLTVYQMLGVK